jgi:hypothetical protein
VEEPRIVVGDARDVAPQPPRYDHAEHDATGGDRQGEKNRPDVFDFPDEYGRQHTNGGKWGNDQTPELGAAVA